MAKSIKKFLKSFTLIELIIVIVVIVVLGASAFLVLSQWMSKSRDSRKIADLGTIDTAINISFTSNDKLPTPDNMTNIMFGGSKVWELGYFGDSVVSQIGEALTKTPFDPTTKAWYRYAQWDNKKYQLGTIVENEQFSDYFSRVYANEYFTRLQGSYNQSIIVTTVGADDVIIPAPSLIIDEFSEGTQELDEEHFWTNKGTYNLGEEQNNKLKVQVLFSGNISDLQDPIKYETFKTNFTNTYGGGAFLKDFKADLDENKIEKIVSAELKKVSSQNVSVQYLSCDNGYVLQGNQCIEDAYWSGDATNGFTFTKLGQAVYPKSCNDLLVSTNPDFKLGVGTAYNGTIFLDGYYYIDLDGTSTLPVLKVFCDMNNDGGGRTRISKNQTTSFTTARYSSCKNNGYHFITDFECISPIYFTNIRFKRNGYVDYFIAASKALFKTESNLNGWQFSPVSGSWYTMRDYSHLTAGFNTGRWGTSHGKFQNEIIVWGK